MAGTRIEDAGAFSIISTRLSQRGARRVTRDHGARPCALRLVCITSVRIRCHITSYAPPLAQHT